MNVMTDEAIDPRVARTRRDVVDATAALLLEVGWDGVTHARVAQRSGYSKATVYAHWPARLDDQDHLNRNGHVQRGAFPR